MTRYLQQKTLFGPQIYQQPSLDLEMVVVIPCFDEKYVLKSLLSLKKCTLPPCSVEVIILINQSENSPGTIQKTNETAFEQITKWSKQNNTAQLKFFPLFHDQLPKKHAGVGLARKIGMDEATWRLEKAGNPDGIIICFDADSIAQTNYLTAIHEHFKKNTSTAACGIHYEHPTNGMEFSDEVYEAIIQYELHLRYYINAQKYTGFPFAFQTIGSSMAVRANSYQSQGGMNKRKAGEDFYFLHKFIESGNFTQLNATTVIPSPRPSDRVPFGTGKAVNAQLSVPTPPTTYAIQSFDDLKIFFGNFSEYYQQPFPLLLAQQQPSVQAFLESINAEKNWEELHQNTRNFDGFKKRFFRWFNAFMLMKYVHFSRDHFHPDIPLLEASTALFNKLGLPVPLPTYLAHLKIWRKLDKSQN